jgi:hypothetical protein
MPKVLKPRTEWTVRNSKHAIELLVIDFACVALWTSYVVENMMHNPSLLFCFRYTWYDSSFHHWYRCYSLHPEILCVQLDMHGIFTQRKLVPSGPHESWRFILRSIVYSFHSLANQQFSHLNHKTRVHQQFRLHQGRLKVGRASTT